MTPRFFDRFLQAIGVAPSKVVANVANNHAGDSLLTGLLHTRHNLLEYVSIACSIEHSIDVWSWQALRREGGDRHP